MGQCYTVEGKFVFKNNDATDFINALKNGRIAYALRDDEPDPFEWFKEMTSVDSSGKYDNGIWWADFDAPYSYEIALLETFKKALEVCEDGSYFEVYPDFGYTKLIKTNGVVEEKGIDVHPDHTIDMDEAICSISQWLSEEYDDDDRKIYADLMEMNPRKIPIAYTAFNDDESLLVQVYIDLVEPRYITSVVDKEGNEFFYVDETDMECLEDFCVSFDDLVGDHIDIDESVEDYNNDNIPAVYGRYDADDAFKKFYTQLSEKKF